MTPHFPFPSHAARRWRRLRTVPCAVFISRCFAPAARLLAVGWIGALLAGCTWHGTRADYVFGPALVRYQPPHGATRAAFLETRQFPLALEAGSQWGITVGGLERFTVAAREQKTGDSFHVSVPNESRRPARVPWAWSFFYFPARFDRAREFTSRGRIGITAGAGAESLGLALGYGRTTRLAPIGDGVYRLDYHAAHAPETVFVVWPLASLSPTNNNKQNIP